MKSSRKQPRSPKKSPPGKGEKNIVLCVCGGIAAYKSAALASGIVREGMSLKTVMTESAKKFITPLTFETLSGNPVYSDLFQRVYDCGHISLAEWADAAIVAPATANTIAKLAAGIADNLLTTFLLDYKGPVFICPSMHENMWVNKVTAENTEKLSKRGYYILGPEQGRLAGGRSGMGRMLEPAEILKKINKVLK